MKSASDMGEKSVIRAAPGCKVGPCKTCTVASSHTGNWCPDMMPSTSLSQRKAGTSPHASNKSPGVSWSMAGKIGSPTATGRK
eukprot:9578047-Heterocapsa_arctica.AAC.1